MKDVIVSVGMGQQQIGFIHRLKELGYYVAAYGKGKNSLEAMNLADYVADIDTRDYQSAIDWLNSLDVNVIAVGSVSGGVAIPTVQELSRVFDVPTKIPNDIMVGGDKVNRQRLMEKYNLTNIRMWKLEDVSKEVVQIQGIDEFIVKPSGGRGSEGIKIVSKSELMKLCSQSSGLHNNYIVQTVQNGKEYRCVMMAQDGKLKFFVPLLRLPYNNTFFTGSLSYSDENILELQEYFNKFIVNSGIKNSVIKSDVLVSDDGINMIEMDIGSPGGIPFINSISCFLNRNILDQYINLITGQPIEEFHVVNRNAKISFIYNQSSTPVSYDLETCETVLNKEFGECKIIINPLHPEKFGGYHSNSDNIMMVVSENDVHNIDDYINENLFKKES